MVQWKDFPFWYLKHASPFMPTVTYFVTLFLASLASKEMKVYEICFILSLFSYNIYLSFTKFTLYEGGVNGEVEMFSFYYNTCWGNQNGVHLKLSRRPYVFLHNSCVLNKKKVEHPPLGIIVIPIIFNQNDRLNFLFSNSV